MVWETHCGNYQCTINRLLSVKSLCLGPYEEGGVINMQRNQVNYPSVKLEDPTGGQLWSCLCF